MSADNVPLEFDRSILNGLACPVCLGTFSFSGTGRLVCGSCGRAYPIVDGIPVLIADRAEISAEKKRG